MNNEISVTFSEEDVRALRARYGNELKTKVVSITQKYMGDAGLIKSEARRIIEDEGQVDTSRLVKSIKPSLNIYASKITAEVKAGTNYARFIHEGAEHSRNGTKKRKYRGANGRMKRTNVHMQVSEDGLVPHFVPFSVAPGLLTWAKRHGKIEHRGGMWYFIDNNNYETPIDDINKSGMMVYQKPLKFFEIPFEKYAPKYIRELEGLLS